MRRLAKRLMLLISMGSLFWACYLAITLTLHAQQSTEALLVLGGSIRREIYAAEWSRQHPGIPILISQGSPPPCIKLIFQREQVSEEPVWLEGCADSTFDNFVFSQPMLSDWGIHTLTLATSATHLPRALWLGRLMLGAHGIWVQLQIVPEIGVPGNQESWFKTSLDYVRGAGWAILSQIYQPHCQAVTHLPEIDLAAWKAQGFRCERQGNLPDSETLQLP